MEREIYIRDLCTGFIFVSANGILLWVLRGSTRSVSDCVASFLLKFRSRHRDERRLNESYSSAIECSISGKNS